VNTARLQYRPLGGKLYKSAHIVSKIPTTRPAEYEDVRNGVEQWFSSVSDRLCNSSFFLPLREARLGEESMKFERYNGNETSDDKELDDNDNAVNKDRGVDIKEVLVIIVLF
jgi:hypothetical protein